MSVDLTIELGTKEIALQLQSPPNLESQPHRPPSSSKNSRGFFSRFAGTPASLRLIRERAFFLESRNFWRSSGDSHRRFIARLIFCRVSALTTFVRLYSASLLLLASVLPARLLASPIFLLCSSLRTLPVAASLILRRASSVCFFPKKGWAFPLPAGLIVLGVFSYS